MIKHNIESKAIPTETQGNQGSPVVARKAIHAIDSKENSNIIPFPISSRHNNFLPDFWEEISPGKHEIADTPKARIENLRHDLALVNCKKMTLTRLKEKHNLSYYYKTWDNHKRECIIKSPSFDKFPGFMACLLNTIGLRPDNKYSLDIVNRSLGFIESNLRWATKATQSKNQSTNKIAKYADKLPWLQDEIVEWEKSYREYSGIYTREQYCLWKTTKCINSIREDLWKTYLYKKWIKDKVCIVDIGNDLWLYEMDTDRYFNDFIALTKEQWESKILELNNHYLRIEKANKLLGHVPRKDIYCKRRGGLGLRIESAIYDIVGDSKFDPGGIAIDDKYDKE